MTPDTSKGQAAERTASERDELVTREWDITHSRGHTLKADQGGLRNQRAG